MDVAGLSCMYGVLLVSAFVHGTTGGPIGNSTIKCSGSGSTLYVGDVDEGYSGDVEVLTGVQPDNVLMLAAHIFPEHLEFVELIFTPGDTSATVRTKKPLDSDVLASTDGTLYYSVRCLSFSQFENRRTLKVNDINDNSPVFQEKFYETSVSETVSVGAEVLRVTAVDADSSTSNNLVSYSYKPQTDDFSMTNFGAFLLMKRLNYNIVPKYNFIVTASDRDGNNDTASVEISVEDFDNLNPFFSHSWYEDFLLENQIKDFDTIKPEPIKAQDGDLGINMTVTYSISSVIPSKYHTNFAIDPSGGILSVVTAIDREETNSNVISVNIKASQTDDSSKTAGAVVSITVEDVNDNPPEFDQANYAVTLLENSPFETIVFKATVTDLDQGGFVGTLEILPESSPFSISPDGMVRVKNSSALDREAIEKISFQIKANETDSPNQVATVGVSVTLLDENDNSPKFTSSTYEGKVFANQTVGMLLVQAQAEDLDAGANGKITYSIDFGNEDGYFSIGEDNGSISLVKTIPLEENQLLEFSLYITARDGGVVSRSTSAQVIIRAPGDSKPQFFHKVYRGSIEEEQEPGAVIVMVSFFAVSPESVSLRVESEADKFSISGTGELYTKTKLDYDEGIHNYSVDISITDGVTSDSAVVQVQITDVNDNSPVFASGSFSKLVPEDTSEGANVTEVSATDKDSGFNKEIRYSLRGGEGSFSIDPVSGIVHLAAELDRETTAEYNLLVVAEDLGRPPRSATATLLVQVSDINDNIPQFSESEYQVEVLETESLGTSLLTLSAADPDEGANGRVTYRITRQNPSSETADFELDSSNGTLHLVKPLDYSEVSVYTLWVQASDGGSPSLSGNSSVVVKVKDVNNNPPEFSQDTYHAAVSENLAGGASILSLEVTDRDEGGFSKGHFLYNTHTFEINKQGVVSLRKNATLDRETQDIYTLQIVAVDQVPDGLSATAQINITILDFNDNSPQFPDIPNPLRIFEADYSEEFPGEIFTIVPADGDIGPNGEVTLTLTSSEPFFTFREDGTLLAVGVLDRESRDTYDLIVTASDRGSPQRQNITTIRVSLMDVNDNAPEFSSSSYTSSLLLKDAEEGKLLLTLSATDQDIGNNSLIRYSFSTGHSPYLALNSETGAVTLASDLSDVTEDTTLVLTAVATDHGSPPHNTTARVVINLRVASLDESTAFQSSSYNFSLFENAPVGAMVGRIQASSGSSLYSISYSLRTHSDLFSISSNGIILTSASLDKEQQEWYFVDVEAVDTRSPPTSATAVVRVQVEDVNESPEIPNKEYKASVFSIAPYKTPVIQVKASDPDVGDNSRLIYSLSSDGSSFDVDLTSGLVYVVSAESLAGQTVTLEMKATDPHGLYATAMVEVEVQKTVGSSDVTTISLNQPPNVVEKKVPELEKSLGKVLDWTVEVIQVSGSSMLRASMNTLVSFVAFDEGEAVSSEEVIKKLQSQSAAVKAELGLLFGEGLHFDIEMRTQGSAPNQGVVIALGVLLGLSVLGLIVAVTFIIRFNRNKKPPSSDKERFDIDRKNNSYRNWSRKTSKTSAQENKSPEDEQQRTSRETAEWDRKSLRLKELRESDESNASRF